MQCTLSHTTLKWFSAVFLSLLISYTMISCNKDSAAGEATMRVHLTDAPGDFQAVYIDIQAVEVTGVGGPVSVNLIRPGIYNLLDFRNGLDTLLGAVTLPAGYISQIRLVLGNNNSVQVDGVIYPLSTPSAQQSGLKLNLQKELSAGIVYDIWIDFDASRSVVQQGNGSYSLKPVIRTFSKPLTGAVKGTVSPAGSASTMIAIQNTDTIGGMVTDFLGNFYIGGLNPGTYRVIFNANPGFIDREISRVVVNAGTVTNMGIVVLL
jgi:hypothetical protein